MAEVSAFEQLTAYWRRLQSETDGYVPERSRFNPARVVQILPYIYLLKQIDRFTIEIRLCGTAIDEFSGASITGWNYLDVCMPEERDFHQMAVHQSLATPCAIRLLHDVTYASGMKLSLASMSYPLVDEDGIARFLVGAVVPRGEPEYYGNGPIVRYILKHHEFIDIGFGVPK